MATADLQVRVLTLDPVSAKVIPVAGAKVACKNSVWLIDPTLSTGTPTTDAQGRAKVPITFDDGAERSLNPYFEITMMTAAASPTRVWVRSPAALAPASRSRPIAVERTIASRTGQRIVH